MMKYQEIAQQFPEVEIYFNDALANYSHTKTGGPADVIALPSSPKEVKEIVDWARANEVPLTILGNLSNLIVRDGGIEGIVMILTNMNHIEVVEDVIYAESGAALIDVSKTALQHDLTGLEFACGIPGSIGGAVFMNAGAYGGEMKDVIVQVDILTRAGELKTLDNEASAFTYRHSIYQETGDIILGASFKLLKGESALIRSEMKRLTDLRQSKQPLEYPSCGSVFKRPVGHFTGQLIQEAGLQGHRIGGAEISKKHAGFIINVGGATATDYTQMIAFIQAEIKERFDVDLEPEVRIIGHD